MKGFSPPLLEYVPPESLPPSLIDLSLTSNASVLECVALGLSDMGSYSIPPPTSTKTLLHKPNITWKTKKVFMALSLVKEMSSSAAKLFNRSLSISSLPSAKLCQIVQVADAVQPPKDLLIFLQVRLFLMRTQAPCSYLHGIVPACCKVIGLDDL